MKKPFNKSTLKTAFCAVISALAVVMMMLTSLIPVGTYALPCAAGALLTVIVIEFGLKWSFAAFAVIGALSFFLAGDKEAWLYFIAFFGYYPILKNIFESRISSKIIQFLLKLAVFNAAAIASFFIASSVLAVPADEYTVFGLYVPYAFLLIGNLFFLLYDRAVTAFAVIYARRVRDKLFGKIK